MIDCPKCGERPKTWKTPYGYVTGCTTPDHVETISIDCDGERVTFDEDLYPISGLTLPTVGQACFSWNMFAVAYSELLEEGLI